ncbi:MAG: hypothetical protein MUD01_04245 [Chloroflexaceae bacterium]|nr:hypothetical protein [Chloroflexaceae bacterium]
MNVSSTSASSIRAGIVLLTFGTALTHMSLLFPDLIFILNGLGYLTLLAALYLPIPALVGRKQLVRWAFIGYTALSIIIWLAIGDKGWWVGWANKLNEVALIGLLWWESRR